MKPDRSWSKEIPWVTLVIIGINVALSITTYLVRGGFEYAVENYGLIPAQFNLDTPEQHIGKLFTAPFFHASFLHLAINMFLLYLFGRDVERVIGRLEYALFYLGACLSASLMHTVVITLTLPQHYEESTVVGASGAVAGLMGLFVVRFYRRVFTFLGTEIPAVLIIMIWFITQMLFGILGLYYSSLMIVSLRNVSYWSHLGGFFFGLLVGSVANIALQGETEHLLDEVNRLHNSGKLLEAAQKCEHILSYNPNNAPARAELGRLWALLEEDDQSIPAYQSAVELFILQGREDDALATYEEMKRFWPQVSLSTSIRYRLACFLEETGQYDQAISAFSKIAETDGGSVEAQMSLIKTVHVLKNHMDDDEGARSAVARFEAAYPDSGWKNFVAREFKGPEV